MDLDNVFFETLRQENHFQSNWNNQNHPWFLVSAATIVHIMVIGVIFKKIKIMYIFNNCT